MSETRILAVDLRVGDIVGPWRVASIDKYVFTYEQLRDCDDPSMADRVLVEFDRPSLLMERGPGDDRLTKRHWYRSQESVAVKRAHKYPSTPRKAPVVRDEMAEHDPWDS